MYWSATSMLVVALAPLDVERPMVERRPVLVQVAHEADQAALEVEGLLAVGAGARRRSVIQTPLFR